MNIKGIRFRLTLWYSFAFFVGSAMMLSVFYLVTRQTLLLQTDQELTVHTTALINIIKNAQPDVMFGIFNQGIIAQQFSQMPGMLVVVTDASGKIIANSQQGAQRDPVINALAQQSLMLSAPMFVDRAIGSSTLRIGIFPIVIHGNFVGLVLMGDPVEAIHRSLNSLLVSLSIVDVVFFIPALAGGHFLARKAMQPISTMSEKLMKITSENLEERVDIPKTGDELENLATTFNRLFDRLSEAFLRERQFISDVAHELKTPVATLRSETELALSKKRSTNEYRQVLHETLEDIQRLSNTIRNILDVAWSQAGNPHPDKRSFDLSGSLRELSEIAIRLANQKQIVVKSSIDPNISIAGDENKIPRAVLNVIDNAIKYTPSGGSVAISLHQKNEYVQLEIKDTGIGIGKKELPHIFKRFYRGSKTVKILGSGLGLAIAEGIIKAHHGKICVLSRIGKGTSVIMTLPCGVIFTKS